VAARSLVRSEFVTAAVFVFSRSFAAATRSSVFVF
jgi:hypothetical protein